MRKLILMLTLGASALGFSQTSGTAVLDNGTARLADDQLMIMSPGGLTHMGRVHGTPGHSGYFDAYGLTDAELALLNSDQVTHIRIDGVDYRLTTRGTTGLSAFRLSSDGFRTGFSDYAVVYASFTPGAFQNQEHIYITNPEIDETYRLGGAATNLRAQFADDEYEVQYSLASYNIPSTPSRFPTDVAVLDRFANSTQIGLRVNMRKWTRFRQTGLKDTDFDARATHVDGLSKIGVDASWSNGWSHYGIEGHSRVHEGRFATVDLRSQGRFMYVHDRQGTTGKVLTIKTPLQSNFRTFFERITEPIEGTAWTTHVIPAMLRLRSVGQEGAAWTRDVHLRDFAQGEGIRIWIDGNQWVVAITLDNLPISSSTDPANPLEYTFGNIEMHVTGQPSE